MSRHKKGILLLHGYIRKLRHSLPQTIPHSVISLCFDFYYIEDPNLYSWKITDASIIQAIKTAKNGKLWKSPIFSMFGFRWFIEIYPNGYNTVKNGYVNLYANLASISPRISSVRTSMIMNLVEADAEYYTSWSFRDGRDMNIGWAPNHLQTHSIQTYDTLTFTLKMELLSVFDQYGNEITDRYLQNEDLDSKVNLNVWKEDLSLSTRIDQLSVKMDTMQQMINDKFDKIMKEIVTMKQNMYQLSLSHNNNNVKAEQEKLKLWLKNDVQLPQYYHVLIENGIEDLNTASLLTMETIKLIGIDKIGHQMKILHQVRVLKQTNIQ